MTLLLITSIGYALFSQQISVTGTATAKGEFDTEMTCFKGIISDFNDYPSLPESGYSNDSCSVSGNDVTISTELSYPTARRYFTIKLTNSGTIDAKIKLGESTYYRWEDGRFSPADGVLDDSDCTTNIPTSGNTYIVDSYNVLGFQKKDGTIIVAGSSDWSNYSSQIITSDGEYMKLLSGESYYLLVKLEISDFPGTSILASHRVNHTFNVEQLSN